MARTRLPWLARLVAAAIAVLLGSGAGVATARAAGEPTAAPMLLRGAVVEAVRDLHREAQLGPIADGAVALVRSLRAELPVPSPPAEDAYAPTPELVHGTIEIPAIGLSDSLYEGVTLTAINRGPSHWPGTTLPGGLGNVVVAGHRTTFSRPFWDLDLLQPGDELIFTLTDGSRHVYVLDHLEIVDDAAIHIVDQRWAYTATLFACHPKGSARQRIVGHFTLRSSTPA